MPEQRYTIRTPASWRMFALVLGVPLTGCVVSIQPTIPQSHSVFQPGLLGTWVSADGTHTALVTRGGETGYQIRYTDEDGKSGTFHGRTGNVGNHLLLEVSPAASDIGASDAYNGLLLPGRLVFVLTLDGAEARTASLKVDALRSHLEHRDTWTPHLAWVDHLGDGEPHILLTGTTAELRTWFAWYLDQPGVLDEASVWRKVRS